MLNTSEDCDAVILEHFKICQKFQFETGGVQSGPKYDEVKNREIVNTKQLSILFDNRKLTYGV